jgi:1-phosphofructokinase family hexose kinase
MLLTVTLNPAIDRTLSVPGFAAGRTNRAVGGRVDAGGKGINVARAAHRLGCPVMALGFLAPTNGALILQALAAEGIPCDFVDVPGQTRTNLKIKDPETGVETEINEPGFRVEPDQIRSVEEKVAAHARERCVVAFSGSLPPGAPEDIYARLIRIAADRGARTVLDSGGAALRNGIAAGPDLVKPNRAEAAELLGRSLEDDSDLGEAIQGLLACGARRAVISLGPGGAAAGDGHGLWRAWAPAVQVRSTIGAGDAMVAALACAMHGGLPLPDALRMATAAGCAAAATEGSAAPELRDVEALLPRVRVAPLTRV